MLVKKILCGLIISVFAFSPAAMAAVVLQYHHIGEETPRVTSASVAEFVAHLDWLEENDFEIIALDDLINRLKNNKLNLREKVASITFDDTGKTICTAAWPILQQRQLPFTIFINTDAVANISNTQCSWQELQQMEQSGLLTTGNHSHSHLHMLDKTLFENDQQWLDAMTQEVLTAEKILQEKLKSFKKIFAYPYGETNAQLQQLMIDLGYSAVGQQSGAIGNNTDVAVLPRFPLSGRYANLETLPDKLLSLPFPLVQQSWQANTTEQRGPVLSLQLEPDFNARVQCFLGSGDSITVQQTGNIVEAFYEGLISPGRNRYNCTASSDQKGRFYWYSYPWLQE